MNVIACGFVVTASCVCVLSFAYCYVFMPEYSIRKNGQMRSLSGIMKFPDLKPYFSFVMGCLGGSLFFACGLKEGSGIMLCLSLGMYVSMIGLLCYDVKYSQKVHLSFVFMLIASGCGFSGFLLNDAQIWCYAAAVTYDAIVSLFLLCFFVNSRLRIAGRDDYRTVQAWLEIMWVLCLVMMMCVYAFQ